MTESKMIIIYKSKTGFTKKYAEMIAGEMECTLADYKTVTAEILSQYNIVVFGSRAHAGMIDSYKKAKEMFQKSKARKFVLFVTGATPNAAEDVIEEFWKQNLTADELSDIPHFFIQSGLCYEKMSFGDKLLMKAAALIMKHKKDKNAFDKEFEHAITGSYDISSKSYIEPLVSFLKKAY